MDQGINNPQSSSWFKIWSIFLGIVMIVLGLVTVSISAVASIFTMIILGIVLLISCFHSYWSFTRKRDSGGICLVESCPWWLAL